MMKKNIIKVFLLTLLPSSKDNSVNNLIMRIDGMMGTDPQASPRPAVQTKLVTSNEIL